MTERRDLILGIVIVCVTVFSTCLGLNGDEEIVCRMNVSVPKSRLIEYTETFPTGFPYNIFWLGHWQTGTRRAYKIVFDEVWEIQQTQCSDYEDKNGTCTPDCSTTCPNGYCAQPNNCTCNYGRSENSSNMSLECFVRVNSTEAISELSALKNVQIVSGNLSIHRMLPECNSKCREQLNTTAVNVTRSADGIFYFIPNDSPCNFNITADSTFWQRYGISIGAVIGFALFTVVACAVCIVCRRRKKKNEMTNQPTELALANYMVENTIYS